MIDWEEILSRDGPTAWKAAWRVLGNRADADECFQEACLSALAFSKTQSVKSWRALLQRLTTARAIDRLRQRIRRRDREHPLPDHLPQPTGYSPMVVAENAELAANLRAALVKLPSGQAEVFCLFHLHDWNYQEIAESQDISVGLVGVWLQRARDRLGRLLVNQNDFTDEVSP